MVTKMISTIVEAISGLLTGVGTSIVNFFDGTVIAKTAEGGVELTTFAVWALAFLGIGFVFGTIKYIMGLVRN